MWLGPDVLNNSLAVGYLSFKANILKLLTILYSFKSFVTHG